MLYNKLIFTFIILLGISCASPKEDFIQEFTNHYTTIIESKSADLSSLLSVESNSYVDNIMKTNSTSLQEILDLGNTYKVPYSTILYFTQINNAKQENNPENYLKYLSANTINIFSYYDIYGISKDNTKIGDENFIAVFRDVDGRNKLDWVKMKKEDEQYKIDLLFLLQHNEHRILKDFQDGIKSNFEGDVDKYLEDVFNRDGTTLINDIEREKLEKERRERFATEFVVK